MKKEYVMMAVLVVFLILFILLVAKGYDFNFAIRQIMYSGS